MYVYLVFTSQIVLYFTQYFSTLILHIYINAVLTLCIKFYIALFRRDIDTNMQWSSRNMYSFIIYKKNIFISYMHTISQHTRGILFMHTDICLYNMYHIHKEGQLVDTDSNTQRERKNPYRPISTPGTEQYWAFHIYLSIYLLMVSYHRSNNTVCLWMKKANVNCRITSNNCQVCIHSAIILIIGFAGLLFSC